MRVPRLVAAVVAVGTFSSACASGHEAHPSSEHSVRPLLSPSAIGAPALAAALRAQHEKFEHYLLSGKPVHEKIFMGMCAAIKEGDTLYTVPNPVQLSVKDPAGKGTFTQPAAYDRAKNHFVYGAVTLISNDEASAQELTGGNSEYDLLFDGPGVGLVDRTITVSDKNGVHDNLGNLVAEVASVSFDEGSVEEYSKSELFGMICDAAISKTSSANSASKA